MRKNRQPLFWKSVGADIIRPQLTRYGQIVNMAINAIPLHYPNIQLDKYVIMPDHIHMILIISSGECNKGCQNIENGRIISAPTIMRVIGQMKRWISKEIGFSIWQKSYFEHIIRNETDYINKAEYILNNPLKRYIENNN